MQIFECRFLMIIDITYVEEYENTKTSLQKMLLDVSNLSLTVWIQYFNQSNLPT